jgi:mono/diheme cytochrome c family protein
MSDRARLKQAALVFVASFGVASAAWGLPWDVDMADGAQVKAYERLMPGLPDGVVSQPARTTPKLYAVNMARGSAEGQSLTNPYADDLELGKKMYGVYCTPCHGVDGVVLGAVAQPGRLPGVVPLAGAAGVAKSRTDGWIYLTIRNGGAVMPSYGPAMSDPEMWATVAYVRTLDNAKYVPPEAP